MATTKWTALTDKEQKQAVSLLHRFRTSNVTLSEKDMELLIVAADFLDEHRHKFKKP